MAENFCTQCGYRLSGTARFCSNCGNPVGKGNEASPGGKTRAPGSILEEEAVEAKTVGLMTADLNELAACSFMNAPLNTEFLLLENTQHDWTKWIPLKFVENMQGLKVVASACVTYYISDRNPALPNFLRGMLPLEVIKAYISSEDRVRVEIEVHPSFKPVNYGNLEAMRGRWVTVTDNKDFCTVRTVTPLPPSGWTMKRRLREHETFINELLAECSDDAGTAKFLNEILADLRSTIQELSDGCADHILCSTYARQNKVVMGAALSDEDQETGKVAFRTDGFRQISAPPARSLPLLKGDLRTAVARRAARIPSIADSRLFSSTAGEPAQGAKKKEWWHLGR